MARQQPQVMERAWAGYTVRLERSDEGWFYRLTPQERAVGAVAGPAEQGPTGPFESEEAAFEDAKTRVLALQRDRPASI
jgi:hypothetical protein